MERTFKDGNGKSRVTIEGTDAPLGGFLEEGTESYTLVNKPKSKKVNGPSNIGPGSNGFAGVATLAAIIAVAGVIIAYLTLRF